MNDTAVKKYVFGSEGNRKFCVFSIRLHKRQVKKKHAKNKDVRLAGGWKKCLVSTSGLRINKLCLLILVTTYKRHIHHVGMSCLIVYSNFFS